MTIGELREPMPLAVIVVQRKVRVVVRSRCVSGGELSLRNRNVEPFYSGLGTDSKETLSKDNDQVNLFRRWVPRPVVSLNETDTRYYTVC